MASIQEKRNQITTVSVLGLNTIRKQIPNNLWQNKIDTNSAFKSSLHPKYKDIRIDGLTRFITSAGYNPLIVSSTDFKVEFESPVITSNEMSYGVNKTAGLFNEIVIYTAGFYEISACLSFFLEMRAVTMLTDFSLKFMRNGVIYSSRSLPNYITYPTLGNAYFPLNSINLEDKIYLKEGDKFSLIFEYNKEGGGANFGSNLDIIDAYLNINLVTKRSNNEG